MKTYQALIMCTLAVAVLSSTDQSGPPPPAGPSPATSRRGRLLLLLGKKALLLKAPLLFKGGAVKAAGVKAAAVGAAGGATGLLGLGGLAGGVNTYGYPSYVVVNGVPQPVLAADGVQQEVLLTQPVLIGQQQGYSSHH